jgi:hypothetical protein
MGLTRPPGSRQSVASFAQLPGEFIAAHLDRPGRSRCRAISYSSARVLGEALWVRLRRATAAPCLPSAVRVLAGRCAIVFLAAPACWAFFTLRLAARACLLVAMVLRSRSRDACRALLYPADSPVNNLTTKAWAGHDPVGRGWCPAWHANDVAPAGQGQLAGSGELGCEFAERNLVSLGKGGEGVYHIGQRFQGDAGADRDAGL